jgi:hypothetical protein
VECGGLPPLLQLHAPKQTAADPEQNRHSERSPRSEEFLFSSYPEAMTFFVTAARNSSLSSAAYTMNPLFAAVSALAIMA